MSNLEKHEAEQAEITAMCEAGECDHSECHEPRCRICEATYPDGGDGWGGECPDCADNSYMNEIVDRSAPRWAWDAIDELIERARTDLDCDGDLILPGEEGPVNHVADLVAAGAAMAVACERANDQPISRAMFEAPKKGFDRREVSAILAGLRLIQTELPRSEFLPQGVHPIFDDDGTIKPLSADEIDALCERINQ